MTNKTKELKEKLVKLTMTMAETGTFANCPALAKQMNAIMEDMTAVEKEQTDTKEDKPAGYSIAVLDCDNEDEDPLEMAEILEVDEMVYVSTPDKVQIHLEDREFISGEDASGIRRMLEVDRSRVYKLCTTGEGDMVWVVVAPLTASELCYAVNEINMDYCPV